MLIAYCVFTGWLFGCSIVYSALAVILWRKGDPTAFHSATVAIICLTVSFLLGRIYL